MRKKYIYASILLLSIFSLTANAKVNVGTKPASTTVKKAAAGCLNTTAQFDLDVNNVRARILNGGDLWWDPVGQIPYYEVPIGSNKNSIFAGALWIAGLDNSGQIKSASQTYRQEGANDFWSGPISKDPSTGLLDISIATCEQYDRFWTITKEEVETFVGGGEASTAIKTWPGNGNPAIGQEPVLAPYFDANSDGVYNYLDGDYPYYNLTGDYPIDPVLGTVCNEYLFGDKTLWWVFNDVGNTHTETQSTEAIGLEVRAQAFGFRTADDINNMTFYKYKIINRSNNTLNQTYFGQWCDPDLGNAADDYVGCDVGLGLGFCYNGDPDDEGADGYGVNPPAVGIDFFQGPTADPGDGIDNDRDGQVDEPGEEIIMTKFVYYKNINNIPDGNPFVLDDYYQYLSGIWLDGLPITYGGSGRDQSNPIANFMFPDNTDPNFPNSWTMGNSGIQPEDMRFLQSAGTFTLQPGAVNFITTGVVWARAAAGGPLASLSLVKLADQKAQSLFSNCFKVLDGPNAPELAIRELDKRLILSLNNTKNDKVEYYNEVDPTIPVAVPNDTIFDTLSVAERSYLFQGYRIYQLSDKNVSATELNDPAKARLYRQIDLKDDIWKIVNFEFDPVLEVWVPTQVADSSSATNLGLTHSMVITTDMFTGQNLINYRPYYYMVVSYAYNNYRPFDPSNGTFTQSVPYKQGRLNVKVYSGIPHIPVVNNGGTVINTEVGQSFAVRRIEGQGNGGNILDLTDATVQEILNGGATDPVAQHPVYQPGAGPVNISVYEPVDILRGNFSLLFEGVTATDDWGLQYNPAPQTAISDINVLLSGLPNIPDTLIITTVNAHGLSIGSFLRLVDIAGLSSTEGLNYRYHEVYIVNNPNQFVLLVDGVTGAYTPGTGIVQAAIDKSTYNLPVRNSQINPAHGLAFDITQDQSLEYGAGSPNNGFLGATMTSNDWIDWLSDNESGVNSASMFDWIRPSLANGDPNEIYETVLNGKWAPMKVSSNTLGKGIKPTLSPFDNFVKNEYLSSVDIVLTSDKSKWTRALVVEMAASGAVNGTPRHEARRQLSVDKDGNPSNPGGGENNSDYVSDSAMGWFPGYAINIETGERLNIVFGENSSKPGQRGADMIWNPTDTLVDHLGDTVLGGMHFVWVFGHNENGTNDVPFYDAGAQLASKLLSPTPVPAVVKRTIWKDAMWNAIPLSKGSFKSTGVVPGGANVKIRLRVHKAYRPYLAPGETAVNASNPYYQFEVPESVEITTNLSDVASAALDNIRVVPNPYYAYSTYERTREDQLDNRVRITNLPANCTVSIYTLNGTLVRQIKRDVVSGDVSEGQAVEEGKDFNLSSTLDWDLKNTAGIPVSSGVYYFHIDAGNLGERVVKWLGVIRPIDLDTF